jgi:hypothetical protein
MLIERYGAKLFAELYSPHFPDLVLVEEGGICRLPRYELWACSLSEPNFIALIGDYQLPPQISSPHYEICGMVLDLAQDLDCRTIITLGGYRSSSQSGKVYVASTSLTEVQALLKHGASPFRGRLRGGTGLLLGLSKVRGMRNLCMLATTTGLPQDRAAAAALFRFLGRVVFSSPT